MEQVEKIKHYLQGLVIAGTLLASSFVLGNEQTTSQPSHAEMFPTRLAGYVFDIQNRSNELLPVSREKANFQSENAFDLSSASEQEKALLDDALDLIYNTPQGKQLLDNLSTFDHKIKIAFSENMGDDNSGTTDPKVPDTPITLNPTLRGDMFKLATTLFHESTHVQQLHEGMSNVNDLP